MNLRGFRPEEREPKTKPPSAMLKNSSQFGEGHGLTCCHHRQSGKDANQRNHPWAGNGVRELGKSKKGSEHIVRKEGPIVKDVEKLGVGT